MASAKPYVENLKPGETDSEVNPEGSLYFGVRDVGTRISRITVNSIATFSKTGYAPTAIPGSIGTYLDVFNDALPEARPDVTAARYLSSDIPYDSDGDSVDDSTYGPVLTIEKAVAGEATERGVLYVEADISATTPVGCEIQLGIQSYTTGTADYFGDATYAGVVAGFVYWPRKTGVFIFFKDDGAGNRYIEVAGPAQDGAGTRLVSTSTAYDWSTNIHAPDSIRVVMDPTVRLAKVFVFITKESDGTYEETLLFESTLDDLGTLQAAARVGNYFAESPPNKVVAFAGIDSGDIGDFVEVHNINVEEYGLFLVGSGSAVSTSTATVTPSDSTVVASYADTAEWDRTEVIGDVTETSTAFTIANAGAGNAAIYKEESELRNERFLVLMQGSVRSSAHEGSFSSGAGIDIDDGTNLTAIRFLDDFSSYRIGLWTGTSLNNTLDFSSISSSWNETTPEILVVADSVQGFCCVWVSESDSVPVSSVDTISIDQAYSSRPTRYNYAKMGLGFVDPDVTALSHTGSFTTSKLFVLPNCRAFVPQKSVGSIPSDSGPWSSWSAHGSATPGDFSTGVTSVESPYWSIIPTSSSTYDYFSMHLTDSTYLAGESGISVVAKIKVVTWSDQFGGVKSIRVPTCGIIAIDVGSGLFMQLRCLLSDSGEKYIFVSADSQDHVEVLNQTAAGQKISALVDFTVAHTYVLSYRPGYGVQVFVDYGPVPAISIAWSERSAVAQASDYLSSGQTASIGAIPYSAAKESAHLEVGLIGVSSGSGFDFNASISVSDEILESSIYGAEANIFVDVSDED